MLLIYLTILQYKLWYHQQNQPSKDCHLSGMHQLHAFKLNDPVQPSPITCHNETNIWLTFEWTGAYNIPSAYLVNWNILAYTILLFYMPDTSDLNTKRTDKLHNWRDERICHATFHYLTFFFSRNHRRAVYHYINKKRVQV
jgi:hypothetical protein